MAIGSLTYDDIATVVVDALDYLKRARDAAGRWEDPSNHPEPNIPGSGQILACEGLLSFLLALRQFSAKPEITARIHRIYPRDQLIADCYALLRDMLAVGRFSGRPYVVLQDVQGKEHPLIDTQCYTVSLVTLAEAVFGPPDSAALREVGQRAMEQALIFLDGCLVRTKGKAKGWAFTTHDVPDRPYKYATWMATDTLSDLFDAKDLRKKYYSTPKVLEVVGRLKAAAHSVRDEFTRIYVAGEHTPAERKAFAERNVVITSGKKIVEDEADNSYAFNLWIILTLLYLDYADTPTLTAALGHLTRQMDDVSVRRQLLKEDCIVRIETDTAFREDPEAELNNKLIDRSFLPQYLKALALFGLWYPDLDDTLPSQIEKALSLLLKNRKPSSPVWDLYAQDGGGFAIYQTERAIEALCRVAEYCEQSDSRKDTAAPVAADVSPAPSMNEQEMTRLGQTIAETVARHAVIIQVDGKPAAQLLERLVETRFAAMAQMARHEARQAVIEPLTAVVDAVARLEGALASASPDGSTIITEAVEEIRRLVKGLNSGD